MIVQAFASAIARASGLGVAAKLAAVTTVVTVAGVSSAAATGALPAPIQSVVADSVDTVTPFNIPRPSDPHAPGSNGIGEQVREQARHHGRDKHQGDTGTDKQSHPTGKPTAPGAKGLQQANSGPAAPHAPDAVPGGKPSSHPGKGDPCAKSTHSPGGPPTSVPGNRPTAAGPGGNGSHSDCPPTQAPGSR